MHDFILLGDTHFGDKGFNLDYFENQMIFYEEQLIPYMNSNNIKTIIQTGDLFDNRSILNIHWFNLFCVRFCDLLLLNNIKLISFLGNHDIVFKNTLEFSMVKYLEVLYKDVFTIIKEQTILDINNKQVLVVPWLLQDEVIDYNKLSKSDVVIGHFEINGFKHSRTSVDKESKLTTNSFKGKQVFSGHYHLNHENTNVKYIGTPYQKDWGEYGNVCGFYHFDSNFEYTFIKNIKSKTFIKFVFDSRQETPLTFCFDDDITKEVTLAEFKKICETKIEVKFYVEFSSVDLNYEEYILVLKENNILYTFIDNQEIESIINPTNIKIDSAKLKSTQHFIVDYIQEYAPELVNLTNDILNDIKEKNA